MKPSKLTHLLISLTLFIALFNSSTAYAGEAEGKTLFNDNCAQCHIIDKVLTGPALMGVRSRWPDTASLYNWIKNAPAVLASGDKYANELLAKYKVPMKGFPNLTDANVSDILLYVDAESARIEEAKKTAGTPAAGGGGSTTQKSSNTLYWILIIALIFIAVILARAVRHLDAMVRHKHNEPERDKTPVWKKKSYRPLMVIIGVVLLGWLSVAMWNSASDLGRQQGYAPDQPIAFSHKVHAGINKIDCRYCHVGAEKGKAAVIPSLSVCMNCHYTIQEMSGTDPNYPPEVYNKEIAKIYSYIGFNKDSRTYDKPAQPIEWVKIHNLPDHVYFNHSQHVNVAGLECQTCHGLIETMDVVEQQGNLSMGWCVNCHRNTEVNFTTNDFYKPYEVLHEKLESGELKSIHAEDIGATECQRCHY